MAKGKVLSVRTAKLSKGQNEARQSFRRKVRSTAAAVAKSCFTSAGLPTVCSILEAGVYIPRSNHENGSMKLLSFLSTITDSF